MSLCQYFDNGRHKRIDILPRLIDRLQTLHRTIESLGKYRFYSGSLLIVYDGSPNSDLIDVRMIDFAHAIRTSELDDEPHQDRLGPDKGYLYGIQCLINLFQDILNNFQQTAN